MKYIIVIHAYTLLMFIQSSCASSNYNPEYGVMIMGVNLGVPSLYFDMDYGYASKAGHGGLLSFGGFFGGPEDSKIYEDLRQNPYGDEKTGEASSGLGFQVGYLNSQLGWVIPYLKVGLISHTKYLELRDETGILGGGDTDYYIPDGDPQYLPRITLGSFFPIKGTSFIVYPSISYPIQVSIGVAYDFLAGFKRAYEDKNF